MNRISFFTHRKTNTVGIEFPQKSTLFILVLRDNGSGVIAKTWDHLILRIGSWNGTDISMRFLSMLVFSHYQSISTHWWLKQ